MGDGGPVAIGGFKEGRIPILIKSAKFEKNWKNQIFLLKMI